MLVLKTQPTLGKETRKRSVEGTEGRDDAEDTASLGDLEVSGEVAGREDPEGDVQEEEDEEERD